MTLILLSTIVLALLALSLGLYLVRRAITIREKSLLGELLAVAGLSVLLIVFVFLLRRNEEFTNLETAVMLVSGFILIIYSIIANGRMLR